MTVVPDLDTDATTAGRKHKHDIEALNFHDEFRSHKANTEAQKGCNCCACLNPLKQLLHAVQCATVITNQGDIRIWIEALHVELAEDWQQPCACSRALGQAVQLPALVAVSVLPEWAL